MAPLVWTEFGRDVQQIALSVQMGIRFYVLLYCSFGFFVIYQYHAIGLVVVCIYN